MIRFVDIVTNQPFSLVSSLIENTEPYAKVAEEWAHAGKLHILDKHPATGISFGDVASERENIQAVLDSVTIPIVVVPGSATAEDLKKLHRWGVDSFDAYAHRLPPDQYLKVKMGRMIAYKDDKKLDSRYGTSDGVQRLAHETKAQVLECSLFPVEEYGRNVTNKDFEQWAKYSEVIKTIPTLISTELKIKPEHLSTLHQMGYKGILIGKIVTGTAVREVRAATRRFRNAIDQIG